MNIKEFLLQTFLYNVLILGSDGWRPFTVKFTNISSYTFVNYVETNSSISSRGSVSLYFNVLQTIPSLYTKVFITVDTSHGIYDLELINKTIDSCEFFKNPRYEPIIQVLYRLLAKSGSFPKSCPITKKLYFVKDVAVDPENLPRILPWKGLFADITMMTKTGNTFETLGTYKIHAQIK